MSLGIGTTSSATDTRTNNQQQTAADNAVNVSNRRSNNLKNSVSYKVAKGGTLTITNGLSEEALHASLESINAGIDARLAALTSRDDTTPQQAIDDRTAAQIAAGGDVAVSDAEDQAALPAHNWILLGAGALVLIFAILLSRGKKKSTP